jgi:hypothetical protein
MQTISDLLEQLVASLLASSTLLQDDNNLFQTCQQLGISNVNTSCWQAVSCNNCKTLFITEPYTWYCNVICSPLHAVSFHVPVGVRYNQWTPCLLSGMITCGRNVKPMPTPLDVRWYVIDRAVMAYKETETDVLYALTIWRGNGVEGWHHCSRVAHARLHFLTAKWLNVIVPGAGCIKLLSLF